MRTIKNIAAITLIAIVGMLAIMPCFLIVTEDENGMPTYWNLVGLMWMFFLAWICRRIFSQLK